MHTPLKSHLFSLLFGKPDPEIVRQAADEAARACHAALQERARRKTPAMAPAEVRGYLRAHAGSLVAKAVDGVLSRRLLRSDVRTQLVARATEQVVQLVADDLCGAKRHGRPRAEAA